MFKPYQIYIIIYVTTHANSIINFMRSFLNRNNESIQLAPSTNSANTRQPFTLGSHFTHQIHQQKCKKVSTKQPTKRTLVYSTRAETRKQSIALFDPLWEDAASAVNMCTGQLKICSALWQSEQLLNGPQVLVLGLQILASKLAKKESENNENESYLLSVSLLCKM